MLAESSRQKSTGSCHPRWISKASWKQQCKSCYVKRLAVGTYAQQPNSYEDAELAQADVAHGGDDDSHTRTSVTLPRWFKARQQYSKRQMAYISPRLGLLNNLPMTVPFRIRLEVFRQFVKYVSFLNMTNLGGP